MIKRLTQGPGGLQVLLALPHLWPLALALLFPIAGWWKEEIRGVGELLAHRGADPGTLLLAAVMGLWTLIGAGLHLALLFSLAGEEELTCDGRSLGIRWGVFGFGLRRGWPVAAVRALGRAPLPEKPPRFLRGLCYFLPGHRPVPFGWSLTEAEAEQVLASLRARYPFPPPGEDDSPPSGFTPTLGD